MERRFSDVCPKLGEKKSIDVQYRRDPADKQVKKVSFVCYEAIRKGCPQEKDCPLFAAAEEIYPDKNNYRSIEDQ